jgi:two-component system CheB/CheR fusion protein
MKRSPGDPLVKKNAAQNKAAATKKSPPPRARTSPPSPRKPEKAATSQTHPSRVRKKTEVLPPQPPVRKSFPVVGIGASAGGLEALEAFFTNMPADRPAADMSFVIIQHLSPKYKSIIDEILKKDTDMPIKEIRDGEAVEPNTVYFNTPDKEVGIFQGAFQLVEPSEDLHARKPIDYFFRSLAQDLEEKAICIVLSGTNNDGTLGLKAVKAAGGMAMAQAEEQARYSFMPRSAIDTGLVDHVLPVEQMPAQLIRYVQHPYLEGRREEQSADQSYQTVLARILMLLRASSKHDFSHYKPTLIRRRIGHRMALHNIDHIDFYYRYLQQNPAEIQKLFKDLVICVTSFFRDPEAFQALETKVFPELVSSKSAGEPIRIWVPGCASGEEALSLAILLDETMERAGRHHPVQIFATDIDVEAIDQARVGKYSASIATDITPERLKRYFVRQDGSYKIKAEIRKVVVYAAQNLISDPPFSRLDLISCRNVLIYLDLYLQRQILPLFHSILNPNGYLFLGSSETIGDRTDLFIPVDIKANVFQRKGLVQHYLADYSFLPLAAADLRSYQGEEPLQEVNARTVMERLVLQEYAPPAVLVDQYHDVLSFQGDTSRFMAMPRGELSYNLFSLAHEDLRPKLLSALHRAARERKTVTARSITFRESEAKICRLDLIVRPLNAPGTANLFLIVFKEMPPPPASPKDRGKVVAAPEEKSRVAILEHELQATREYFENIVAELETSKEELQSSNEELVTANEELKVTNEQLVTVNSKLNSKVNGLTEVNSDLNTLLASTGIGIILLDQDLHIKLITPAATRLFNLIPSDVGRSIKDISPRTFYENLWQDAAGVLHSLQVKELEVKGLSGEMYAIRIQPYRNRDDAVEGVAFTFIEIPSQPSGLANPEA